MATEAGKLAGLDDEIDNARAIGSSAKPLKFKKKPLKSGRASQRVKLAFEDDEDDSPQLLKPVPTHTYGRPKTASPPPLENGATSASKIRKLKNMGSVKWEQEHFDNAPLALQNVNEEMIIAGPDEDMEEESSGRFVPPAIEPKTYLYELSLNRALHKQNLLPDANESFFKEKPLTLENEYGSDNEDDVKKASKEVDEDDAEGLVHHDIMREEEDILPGRRKLDEDMYEMEIKSDSDVDDRSDENINVKNTQKSVKVIEELPTISSLILKLKEDLETVSLSKKDKELEIEALSQKLLQIRSEKDLLAKSLQ